MGSSSAYFLANRMSREMGKICVIERDPTVSILSGLRNIIMQIDRCTVKIFQRVQFNSIQFVQLVISRMLKVLTFASVDFTATLRIKTPPSDWRRAFLFLTST